LHFKLIKMLNPEESPTHNDDNSPLMKNSKDILEILTQKYARRHTT